MYIKHTQKEFVKVLKFNQVNIMTYRKIPLIRVPYILPPPLTKGPSNFSSLVKIKFTKNFTLPQVFSCIFLVQFIYPFSPYVEILPKFIAEGTEIEILKLEVQCIQS